MKFKLLHVHVLPNQNATKMSTLPRVVIMVLKPHAIITKKAFMAFVRVAETINPQKTARIGLILFSYMGRKSLQDSLILR